MLTFLKVLSIIISIVTLIDMCITIKKFHSIIPIIIVFDFVMVIPIILELMWGDPKTSYSNFILAMNDNTTNLLFYLFVISAQIVFLLEIQRISKLDRYNKIKIEEFSVNTKYLSEKYKPILLLFCFVIPFIVIIAISLSPDPMYYFNLFNISQENEFYNVRIMDNLVYALLLAVAILKWYDDKNTILTRIIRIIYVVLIMMANHKRTFMMIAIGICLVIDIIKNAKLKKTFLWYLIYISFAIFYFVYYADATNKMSADNNWYYVMNEYFFRSLHTKFAIFAALHPTEIHILDYPGQSILSDLFFFIPRRIWISKPWPYTNYFISGLLGYSTYYHVNMTMPPSWYPEFVSNFGVLGLWVSLIFTVWVSRFLDRRKLLCKILGTIIICLLEVYYFDNALKILTVIFIIFYLHERHSKKLSVQMS